MITREPTKEMLEEWKSTPAYAEQFLFMRVFNLHLQFS